MRPHVSLTARTYVPGVRGLLLTLSLVAAVLMQAGSAGGRESYREWLTFNEVRLDGSKRVLSRHDVFPESSSLSPDHRQLAYAPYVYDGAKSRELWIAEVNRSSKRLLHQASGWILGIAWAPNGRTIALSVGTPDNGIWLVEADGSGLRRLTDLGFGLAWSPDSQDLAFMRLVNGHWSISTISVDSGRIRDLGAGQNPQWSPDGSRIAYEKVLGCDCLPEIRVWSVSNGASRRLVRGLSPSWSPDGRRIAYMRTRQPEPWNSLWVVPSRGGRPRFLADRARTGIWSPSGRWIAFTRVLRGAGYCNTGLMIVPTRGGALRRLAVATRYIAPQAWTRSGRVLYAATKCFS
jgi:Tol biopolymer transport system component